MHNKLSISKINKLSMSKINSFELLMNIRIKIGDLVNWISDAIWNYILNDIWNKCFRCFEMLMNK